MWAQEVSPPNPNAGTALLGDKEAGALATRMVQLIESTAVVVPGLVRASEPLKQSAADDAGRNAADATKPRADMAIHESRSRLTLRSPTRSQAFPFPAAADRQYAELRDGSGARSAAFRRTALGQNAAERKPDSDPNGLKRYADANSKLLPAGKTPRVVFLGDSITDAWRLNEYFTGRDFVNRGIGGQTTSQMLARFRQDVLALNPKLVVILAGTNDIADGIAAHQIEDNLAMMGDLAKAHGIKVVFASILPVNDYHKDADPQFRNDKEPAARDYLGDQPVDSHSLPQTRVCWMDYYSALVDPMGQMKADLSDDGLHPNAKGYRVMSPVALETIDAALSRQPQENTEENAGKRRFRIFGK